MDGGDSGDHCCCSVPKDDDDGDAPNSWSSGSIGGAGPLAEFPADTSRLCLPGIATLSG